MVYKRIFWGVQEVAVVYVFQELIKSDIFGRYALSGFPGKGETLWQIPCSCYMFYVNCEACCTYLSAFRPCNGFFRRHWGLALVYSWLRGLDRDDWLSKENWWSRQPLAITDRQGCDEEEEVKDANKENNLKRLTSRRTRLKLRNEWKKNSFGEITSYPPRCWYGLETFWLM